VVHQISCGASFQYIQVYCVKSEIEAPFRQSKKQQNKVKETNKTLSDTIKRFLKNVFLPVHDNVYFDCIT
jgi:hypothetical protein